MAATGLSWHLLFQMNFSDFTWNIGLIVYFSWFYIIIKISANLFVWNYMPDSELLGSYFFQDNQLEQHDLCCNWVNLKIVTHYNKYTLKCLEQYLFMHECLLAFLQHVDEMFLGSTLLVTKPSTFVILSYKNLPKYKE